jgi:hypothetical protein
MAISLSTIATGARMKAPKVAIYGVGGIGKTTFAAGAPNPIFLFTEEGQGRLDVARFEPRPKDPVLKTWTEIIDCLTSLYSEAHDYGTVVLDSVDFAEPLLWRYVAEKHKKADIEAFGYGKGYVYAVDEARILFQWLDALRNDRNMAVVLVAHSQTKKFESPDAETYDRYQMRLQDRLAAFVHDWVDVLLFANYKTAVVKDDEGHNRERTRGVGLGERVIYTEERPAWWAKNRYGLPFELSLNWTAFQNAIVVPEPAKPATDNPEKKTAKAAKEN